MLTVTNFTDLYPDAQPGRFRPLGMRSTGLAFYRTSASLRAAFSRDERGSMEAMPVLLVSMQQTIELLLKSIGLQRVAEFDPRKYGHDLLKILRDNGNRGVDVFDSLLASDEKCRLLGELQKAYLAVRYGEAHFNYEDMTAWPLFCSIVADLTEAATPSGDTVPPA